MFEEGFTPKGPIARWHIDEIEEKIEKHEKELEEIEKRIKSTIFAYITRT